MPSGLNAQSVTSLLCPFRTAMRLALATSHRISVESSDEDKARVESELKAQSMTSPLCPFSMATGMPLATSQSISVLS
jgi:hypothetical protein